MIAKNESVLPKCLVYVIEVALKLSPLPLSVERKKLVEAQDLYIRISLSMEKGQPKLLELNCEQVQDKKIAVLTSELLAVQIYEKTASGVGSKRPGFTLDA